MTLAFELGQGQQTGTINLNNREIIFQILFSDYSNLYYIDLFENGELILGGRNLVNGGDLLYNYAYLDLGTRLEYIGFDDLSEGYLVYER